MAACPSAKEELSRRADSLNFTFVIPARNEEHFLGKCLESIRRLERGTDTVAIEVIVVDNQSTDSTADIARMCGARVITVAPGAVSRARNAGAASATGNVLAFVDADCELPPDWLTICLQSLSEPGIVAVGTRMAVPPDVAPWVERIWFELAHRRSVSLVETVQWLPTFNLLVRRDAFLAVAGFDESLVTCEDVDLGYRLSAVGRLIRDHRTGTCHHGESKTLAEFFRREAWRSRGTIPSIRRRGVGRGEWASLLGPPLFIVLTACGMVGFVLSNVESAASLSTVMLLLGLGIPAFVVIRRIGRRSMQPFHFLQCYLLTATYLIARSLGILISVGRVEHRKSAPAREFLSSG